MRVVTIIIAIFISVSFYACNSSDEDIELPTTIPDKENNLDNIEDLKLKITINNQVLTAVLIDNPTTRDFISLLPFTVKLDDYASTEKIFYLSRKLSVENAPSGIDPDFGDITYYSPWGNIAIFYRDSGYANGLVRIAKIENNTELLQVSGSIKDVKFELIENNE